MAWSAGAGSGSRPSAPRSTNRRSTSTTQLSPSKRPRASTPTTWMAAASGAGRARRPRPPRASKPTMPTPPSTLMPTAAAVPFRARSAPCSAARAGSSREKCAGLTWSKPMPRSSLPSLARYSKTAATMGRAAPKRTSRKISPSMPAALRRSLTWVAGACQTTSRRRSSMVRSASTMLTRPRCDSGKSFRGVVSRSARPPASTAPEVAAASPKPTSKLPSARRIRRTSGRNNSMLLGTMRPRIRASALSDRPSSGTPATTASPEATARTLRRRMSRLRSRSAQVRMVSSRVTR